MSTPDALRASDAAAVVRFKKSMVDFVSSATGGPFDYKGRSMKEVHADMGITDAQFDAAKADLRAALEKNGVAADDVKAVLAAVEGTRKDIVETGKPVASPPPKVRTFLGNINEYFVTLPSGETVRAQTPPKLNFAVGDAVALTFDASRISVFPPAGSEPR